MILRLSTCIILNEIAIEAVKVVKEAEQREDVKDTLILMYALFQKFVSSDYRVR